MDGLILIDKPSGWTSFDVVAKVRGILRSNQSSVISDQSKQTTDNRQHTTRSPKVKVGHAGTLDPLATGLMLILVGSYCKRASEFSKLDKTYEVTMRLGVTSTTGDEEGEKSEGNNRRVEKAELIDALGKFTGEIMQTPHKYSAIKVNGQRAYKLARAGREVKIEPRKVHIFDIKLIDYSYPEVKFSTQVSSGTYIRSLVEDLGNLLETGAYMSELRRTKVGNFSIEQAISINDFDAEQINSILLVA